MHETFTAITLLTLGAAVIVWLLQRIGLSPIIGYLLLGMIARPFQHYLFNIDALAEIGVIMLMFFIGLEFHLGELTESKSGGRPATMIARLIAGGFLQIFFCAAASGVIAYWMGQGVLSAVLIGIMFAFSSTALVVKAFEDRRQTDSQRSRMALAVLLVQDIAAILIVAILPLLPGAHASGDSGDTSLRILQKLGVLFVLLPLLFAGSRYLLPRMFQRAAVAHLPEAFSLLSLGACLSVALLAQLAGASLALGAFLGGLVLSRTAFASQILADLTTLRNLSLALFFVTVGMLVDLHFVAAHWWQLAAGLVLLIALKTSLTMLPLQILRTPLAVSAGVGLALAQIGEFSFVLGREAQMTGLIAPEAYQFILAIAVLSMLLTPMLVSRSAAFGNWLATKAEKSHVPGTESEPRETDAVSAVIVGYGPVGRTLARIMKDFGIQPVIIDLNIETICKLTETGMKAVYGDAGRREILKTAGIERATYLLVTLPDLPGRIPVVATARILNPNIKIVSRARYLAERAMLEEAGATSISYEEAEVAVSLAAFLLRDIGAEQADIQREAQRIRSEIAVRTGFTIIGDRRKD